MKELQIPKKTNKSEREKRVLLALIERYILTGKPVGSQSLKDAGIEDLSSATIRNYFANLEKDGFLSQHHISGGRVPTDLALQFYATEHTDSTTSTPEADAACLEIRSEESKEIARILQRAAEKLSSLSGCAVFLSAPRFDQDFIVGMRLISIDHARAYCILITDFGVVKGELIHIDHKLSSFTLKRIEEYFHWRLTGLDYPEDLEESEAALAQRIYNELMVRYIVNYSNFTAEEAYHTGFSKLVAYPEFQDAATLASSLSLFENASAMRQFSKACCATNKLKFWIGNDVSRSQETPLSCAVIAAPYHINMQTVGAIGLLGPSRMPYREMFGLLRLFAASISEMLTKNVYKFKIQYRQPHADAHDLNGATQLLQIDTQSFLLEDKRRVGDTMTQC